MKRILLALVATAAFATTIGVMPAGTSTAEARPWVRAGVRVALPPYRPYYRSYYRPYYYGGYYQPYYYGGYYPRPAHIEVISPAGLAPSSRYSNRRSASGRVGFPCRSCRASVA